MMALANTLVSTTRRPRIRMDRYASIFQNVGKYFFSHSASHGLSTDVVHRLLKLDDVVLTNALIFFRGHDHGDIAILAAYQHRLTLGGVEQSGEALFCVGGCYRLHLSIIDKIDNSDNTQI